MKLSMQWVVSAFVLASLVVIGCGPGGPTVAEVEGTVKLGGKPLDKIQVEFWPESQGRRSFGVTDAQGRFKLTTDDGKQQGATIGSHKVVLKDLGMFKDDFKVGREAAEGGNINSGQANRIPGKYADAQTSSLIKEVKAGEKNDFELEVTP